VVSPRDVHPKRVLAPSLSTSSLALSPPMPLPSPSPTSPRELRGTPRHPIMGAQSPPASLQPSPREVQTPRFVSRARVTQTINITSLVDIYTTA
jgi:hypothetical protein